jgi:hypothetical protein
MCEMGDWEVRTDATKEGVMHPLRQTDLALGKRGGAGVTSRQDIWGLDG